PPPRQRLIRSTPAKSPPSRGQPLVARNGEAVAEPIELFGIDPIDAKPAFQQGFDDRALGHFDGHPNDRGRGPGAGNQPIAQLLDPCAAMRNGSFPQTLSMGIDPPSSPSLLVSIRSFNVAVTSSLSMAN